MQQGLYEYRHGQAPKDACNNQSLADITALILAVVSQRPLMVRCDAWCSIRYMSTSVSFRGPIPALLLGRPRQQHTPTP
jgi:hypothetical protein